MDPVDQPGASKPQPGSDPMQAISDADVEKTLHDLESMATTLVQEVGTPATSSTRQIPASAADPRPGAAPTARAKSGVAVSTEAALPAPPAPTSDGPVAPAAAVEPPQAAVSQAEPQADPNASAVKAEVASSDDAEVEQEINQAIQQLQAGKPARDVAGPEGAKADPSVKSSLCRRLLRSPTRLVDVVFTPMAVVVLVLDLPFRWVPAIIKQLLGYVAAGTALMAGALWYYIIATKPH